MRARLASRTSTLLTPSAHGGNIWCARILCRLGAAAGDRYQQLAKQLTDYRDRTARGVVANLDDLRQAGATPAVIAALRDTSYASTFAVMNVEIVGPKVGSELRRQAVFVTLYALAGMLFYIAFRFEWVYGAAAVHRGLSRRTHHPGTFFADAF